MTTVLGYGLSSGWGDAPSLCGGIYEYGVDPSWSNLGLTRIIRGQGDAKSGPKFVVVRSWL
jgi:hypothetical protein